MACWRRTHRCAPPSPPWRPRPFRRRPPARPTRFNHDRQQSLFSEPGWPRPEPWQIIALVAGVAALWGLGYLTWTQWRQRLRSRDPLDRTWRSINRRLARAGLPRAAAEGPFAYAERLCARWPQHQTLWRELATGYAIARYGQGDQTVGTAGLRRIAHALRKMGLEKKPASSQSA